MIDYHPLIVNTTPLGMYPDVDSCPPIPYEYLDERHFLYDLIYNPEKTLFLAKGEARGAKIKNGLQMLQIQAESAWQIWNQ
jgi:shikimate dehydrogenase